MSADPEIIAAVEDKECQELRDWAAQIKMGWYLQTDMVMVTTGKSCAGYFDKNGLVMYYEDWHPDIDLNQCFMLVEKMRKEGWRLCIKGDSAMFETLPIVRNYRLTDWFYTGKLALTILKAAKDTEKQNGND